ncbi:pyridoxine/pyridoxamine 5'-phosphate oxidase 2-like isoform X4 [Raphanus sativus]|uniref:Pyridoxine/pyridoxamine 5'-phosphate oxidase 2-like isoform X4 n=1 Tax=Raphanus sativus TaxID=3726 RepID=A0A9W3CEC6_RAPSA|nr:pyridoxine/pyridoxamine 5'-phosphate oxidase 2-like isoform X4 [Raphanus sativus]XP_056849729.1 pyridoxine/pyridoxamine 5'-phosphate oxidase 2-like isoform X4 [Raphanus sativus]
MLLDFIPSGFKLLGFELSSYRARTGDLKRRVTGFKPTPIFVVIQELKQFPFSQDTWEHVRINGKVEVIDASNSDQTKLQEKASFANSLKSRLMYICPAPGTPYNNEQPNQEGH